MKTGFIQENVSLSYLEPATYAVALYTIEPLEINDVRTNSGVCPRFAHADVLVGFRTVLLDVSEPGTYVLHLDKNVDTPRFTLLLYAAPAGVPQLADPAPVLPTTRFVIDRVRYEPGHLLVDVRRPEAGENVVVELRGSVSKRMVWDGKKTQQQLRLPYAVGQGREVLRLEFDDARYEGVVFDPRQFPSKVGRADATGSFRLDKACAYPVVVSAGNTSQTLPPGTVRFTVACSDTYAFHVEEHELFTQRLDVESQPPVLTVRPDPVRFVLDAVAKQDVVVWVEGVAGRVVIPTGSTSVAYPFELARGMRKIVIAKVENARLHQCEWVVSV